MKNIFTLFAFVISLSAFSQNSNLIIFNNSGQQFFVILNGIKQNSIPKTNVKIEGLSATAYKVKIIFANGKTGDIDKSIYMEPNMEYSAEVAFKKGKGKLRLFDLVALNTSPYGKDSERINYRANETVVYSDQQTTQTVSNGNGTVQVNVGTVNEPVKYDVQTSGQTTTNNSQTTTGTQMTTTTTVNGQTTQVSVNSGFGNMNGQAQTSGTHTHADGTVHDQNHQPVNGGTHTHADGTVHDHNHKPVNVGTHTHADGTVHDQNHKPVNGGTHTHADGTVHDHNHQPVKQPLKPVASNTPGNAVVNADGSLTCKNALTNIDGLIAGIKEENFSSDQMTLVKTELNTKCINSDQAYRIVNSFTFDGDKIAMAKFCYDHMTDKENAKKMLDLFTFSSSKDELKKYFAGK